MSKEQAISAIEKLVEKFKKHDEQYHQQDYNEAKTRLDFINPFFKALGWDIDNESGDSEAYREVIYEDKVLVKGKTKAPDYGFRLQGMGSKRLFYVEAKKPSVSLIKAGNEAAYQLRRYGSSAQVPVSILTNFEDFIVYDCTRVPNQTDKPTVARLKHIHYDDYINEIDFIYDTFSHEAVTKGRFDKFMQSGATKRGTDTLDKRFVQSLDKWRQTLAVKIAPLNPKLTDEELNYTVQLTIDRLIFLRFCEDRGVEPYGAIQKSISKGDAYKNLVYLFKEADDKYNSGLFDFKKDTITPTLKIDKEVIKNIVDELYYPVCHYEFSVMPVEILGNAYEQFLGKVIRITPARRVKIEEKPEVRKAGGVYYTPQYIVEYIVKNTVGKLIEDKAPTEIEKIKIVDPACGSGSFLLGAYEYLLNYHIHWYHTKGYATKKIKDNPLTPQGTLTTHEKKRILLNNIYGVDLDANAVEVTKLSLLLKCLQGETQASIEQQLTMHHERVLPNLDDNIKDGNSLIDTDFYDSEIDLGLERSIKPFSWKKAYPTVFKQGGFDVVIGNPPYVDYRLTSDIEQDYIKQKYFSANTKEKYSLYIPFIELGHKILKNGGLFGFITPNTFLSTNMGYKLREFIINNTTITEITDVSKLRVFGNVGTYPILIFYRNLKSNNSLIKIAYLNAIEELKNIEFKKIKQSLISPSDKYLISTNFNTSNIRFLSKLDSISVELGTLSGKFVWGTSITGFKTYKIQKNEYEKLRASEKSNYARVIQTADIKPFWIEWQEEYINKEIYSPGVIKLFEVSEKIVLARLTKKIQATIDNESFFLGKSSMILNPKIDIKLLLGLLNSSLLNYYYKIKFENTHLAGGYLRFDIPYLSKLPIIKIIPPYQQKEITNLVSQLLQLKRDLKEEKLQSKIDQIKQRIAHSEDRINQLVYTLYGLTENEIKTVEEAVSN